MIAVVALPRQMRAPRRRSVPDRPLAFARWLPALTARRVSPPSPSSPPSSGLTHRMVDERGHNPGAVLDHLYQAHAHTLLTYLAARLPSLADAEDALADVFLKAVRSGDAGEIPGAGWLFAVARRTIADFYRERSRALAQQEILAEGVELMPAGEHAEPECVAVRAEERRELRSLIAALPDDQRDALALRFAGGLRSAEIAAILGKSDEATRALLSRAVRRLREEWPR